MPKLIFLLVLCILLMPQHSYAGAGQEGSSLHANPYVQNRKVLSGMEMQKKKKVVVDKAKQKEAAELGRELREAPMGPDPLHHNGAPPRKPKTTLP